jgi:hypothetical protein
MPGVLAQPLAHSKGATIRKLGETFAAEITGMDLEEPLSQEAFQELEDAVTKASFQPLDTAIIKVNHPSKLTPTSHSTASWSSAAPTSKTPRTSPLVAASASSTT